MNFRVIKNMLSVFMRHGFVQLWMKTSEEMFKIMLRPKGLTLVYGIEARKRFGRDFVGSDIHTLLADSMSLDAMQRFHSLVLLWSLWS